MRASDIINQVSVLLPRLCDDFTEKADITSLSVSGTTLTATTATAHGLEVNKSANIVGALTPLAIESLERDGMRGGMVLSEDHDITLGSQPTITITDSPDPIFNGTFDIVSVPNRRIIFFKMDDGPFVTVPNNAGLLLDGSSPYQSVNGLHRVDTVPSETSFSVELSEPMPDTTFRGSPVVKTAPRISGGLDIQELVAAYTATPPNQRWLHVVLGDSVASKDPRTDIDSTTDIQKTQSYRQYYSQTVSLYVFIPTSNQLVGRQARDRAEELFLPVCQSVLFSKFDSLVSAGKRNPLIFVEHGGESYNKAFYVHRYTFEVTSVLTFEDTVGYDEDVAFRDIHLTMGFDIGTGDTTIISEIDLDDNPL